MKVIPISAYLSEFDVNPMVEVPATIAEVDSPELTSGPNLVASEQELEERFREGIRKGEEKAKTEFDQKLQKQAQQLSEQHTQALASIQEHFAGQFIEQLKQHIEELETNLSNTLADIVKPFVSELLKKKILHELQEAITDILRDSGKCQLTVKGPVAMLKRLEVSLDNRKWPIEFVETDDLEVSIDVAHAKIESRFQLWAKLIEEETR